MGTIEHPDAPQKKEKDLEPISAQIEEFSDLECNGPFCPHEMTNKHYIFTEKDLTQALNDAYKDGQDDGRGEMIMNSQGFIETTILPAEMIEKVKAESHAAGVEEGIRKAIHTIDKLEVYNTKGMTWEIAKREILKALESLGSN
jgi:hypothetical protein